MFDPETNGLKPLQECAFQVNLSVKGDELYMTLYQRSQDMITASYWNVAQYAALMMMFAHDAGLRPAVFTHSSKICMCMTVTKNRQTSSFVDLSSARFRRLLSHLAWKGKGFMIL